MSDPLAVLEIDNTPVLDLITGTPQDRPISVEVLGLLRIDVQLRSVGDGILTATTPLFRALRHEVWNPAKSSTDSVSRSLAR